MVARYVGSHGAANGVEVLVWAAAVLRDRDVDDIALVLVGDGPEKSRCEKLAASLGLTNVMFSPPVPKHAVPGVLQALDVTLFCLRDLPVFRYRLSSNKLFDHLGGGRPVVLYECFDRQPGARHRRRDRVRPEKPRRGRPVPPTACWC